MLHWQRIFIDVKSETNHQVQFQIFVLKLYAVVDCDCYNFLPILKSTGCDLFRPVSISYSKMSLPILSFLMRLGYQGET